MEIFVSVFSVTGVDAHSSKFFNRSNVGEWTESVVRGEGKSIVVLVKNIKIILFISPKDEWIRNCVIIYWLTKWFPFYLYRRHMLLSTTLSFDGFNQLLHYREQKVSLFGQIRTKPRFQATWQLYTWLWWSRPRGRDFRTRKLQAKIGFCYVTC